MEKGIKFKMKDGTFEYYDPIKEDELTENDLYYILDMAYTYEVLKADVKYFEWYNMCPKCNYELPNYCVCEM